MIRIAVDAMGGDQAPAAIVDGAVAAARHLDIQIALVGVPTQVEQALDAHPDWRSLPVTVVDAPDVIEMTDSPGTVRRKPGASIRVAAGLVARREAEAVRNAIAMAYRFAAGDFIQRVEHEIAAATVSRH